MARLSEEKALTIWRSLAMDSKACRLFEKVRLEAEWGDTGMRVEESDVPIVQHSVRVVLNPREGASAVALLDLVVKRCGVDSDFDAPGGYGARINFNGNVVIG